LSTFISGGYDFHFGLLTVGPVAALQYTYANVDGFSENGSLAPMRIQSDSVNSLRSDVGFRLFYPWQVGKVIIEPSLKAAWEHEYLYSALPVTAGFTNIPGSTATFTGPAKVMIARSSAPESPFNGRQLWPVISTMTGSLGVVIMIQMPWRRRQDQFLSGRTARAAATDSVPHFLFAMFGFLSSKVGCIGSIVVSIIGTLILIALMRGCSGWPMLTQWRFRGEPTEHTKVGSCLVAIEVPHAAGADAFPDTVEAKFIPPNR
jgi:hypothetical protein